MGLSSSKAHSEHDENVKSVRKQIGKRSSVNFLQRLDSRPLQVHRPTSSLPPRAPDLSYRLDQPLPQPLSSHPPPLSPSSSTTIQAPVVRTLTAFEEAIPSDDEDDLESLHSTRSSVTEQESAECDNASQRKQTLKSADEADTEKSSEPHIVIDSDVQHAGTDGTPVITPQLSSDGSQEESAVDSTDEEELSDPETPLAPPLPFSFAPMLRVPTPLAQDSPTRYGFEEAMETARVAVTREIQKKRATTGPELFRQALDLLVSTNYTNAVPQPKPLPCRQASNEYPSRSLRIYRPRNKYPPAEMFRRTLVKQHMLPPPRGKDPSSRIVRLLRRPYPLNLVRDSPIPGTGIHYALSDVINPAQRHCHTGHAKWYETNQMLHPAECAVCLCAGDCEHDSKVGWMCGFCGLRVCGECRARFAEKGMRGLMARERDGSKTVEARRGKTGRKSVVG
ncbi:Ubiquitin carboxyl-terminal hydrolase 45 [Sphaceloma murrayae]|uniref:Ubiquitin carboxyl-terminal hydrolase 45 n=1 Tax=Sphaceloma murrayae TaxID=2082308 RepID=A0A2K1QJE4_9PEZI|nr:Ubiquitin carboxyl-terminal hydrolase 45 [Sphaceloma murrayae]